MPLQKVLDDVQVFSHCLLSYKVFLAQPIYIDRTNRKPRLDTKSPKPSFKPKFIAGSLVQTNVNPSDISLRPFNLNDLDDYFALITDDQVSQFCNWNIHITKEEVKAYLKEIIIPDPWFKAICLRDRPIGDVTVTRAQGSNRCRAEIGYTLSSMYWGQGIATQVVKMVVSGIFEEMKGLERVEALIDVENVRSHRVVEKAGFVKEGVLKKYWLLKGRARDMVVYRFLRPDRVGEARSVAMECLIARKIGGKGIGSTLVILGVFVLPVLLFARKKSYA